MKFKYYQFIGILVLLMFITNISIILDISILRQCMTFLFLTFIPGLLIIEILKLDKLELTEKIVLSLALSVSLIMVLGLLINTLGNFIAYNTPLSPINLLIGFNIIFLALISISYKLNHQKAIKITKINLKKNEKAFLIPLPLVFTISILGTYQLAVNGNNLILLSLLIVMALYVVCITFLNNKFSKRIYPITIFAISISLLVILMLRYQHIMGNDVHVEYYLFKMTLLNSKWNMLLQHTGFATYDACLSVSILPATLQSLANFPNPELFFKGTYVFIFSFSPIVIYLISRKYVENKYAFLGAFFFMSQVFFLKTAANIRTSIAIFFIAMLIMTLFNDKIELLKKKILIIIFLISIILSHYSSSYILLIILIITFTLTFILFRDQSFKKGYISYIIVLLTFVMVFFWYSQITGQAFDSGIIYIKNIFVSFNDFFVGEMRDQDIIKLTGQNLSNPLSRINLILTLSTFVAILIGVFVTLRQYKDSLKLNIRQNKNNVFKKRIEVEYILIALTSGALLGAILILPFASQGYDMGRLYLLSLVSLATFFIIGCIYISKFLRINASVVILIILIPYFLFATDVAYQSFGYQSDYTLSSNATNFNPNFVDDADTSAATWLSKYNSNSSNFFTFDLYGRQILMSQGLIDINRIDQYSIASLIDKKQSIDGYIFLNYYSITQKEVIIGGTYRDLNPYLTELNNYQDVIYDTGYSKIYL